MCSSCDWEDLIYEIEGALEDGDFDWASDTLEGILEWVKANEHCTEGQKQAIRNILNCRH